MKKKRSHPFREYGRQSFWISTSDLMAGVVFIFLIILAVFSIQFKVEKFSFEETKRELRSSAKTRRKILLDIKDRLEKEGVVVNALDRQGILRIHDNGIHFLAARPMPSEDRLENIGKLARALGSIMPCYASRPLKKVSELEVSPVPKWCGVAASTTPYQCDQQNYPIKIDTIMIEGHTDPTPVKPTASYADNLTLSAMRASNVWRLLQKCQPSLASLSNQAGNPVIAVSGYSFLRPAYSDRHDPRNRRIDLRFVMDLPVGALDEKPHQNKLDRRRISSLPKGRRSL